MRAHLQMHVPCAQVVMVNKLLPPGERQTWEAVRARHERLRVVFALRQAGLHVQRYADGRRACASVVTVSAAVLISSVATLVWRRSSRAYSRQPWSVSSSWTGSSLQRVAARGKRTTTCCSTPVWQGRK